MSASSLSRSMNNSARASLATPSLHIEPHLCSMSAFAVRKRACSARASSRLTSKESASSGRIVCLPTHLEDVLAFRADPRQPVHTRLSEYQASRCRRLLTSSSPSLKLLIRDCTQYRGPSRQSDWTFMSSSMRLDVTRLCLQRASGSNLCVRVQR